MTTILKTCIALCISLLLVCAPFTLLNGCGGYEEPVQYSFFNPDIIKRPGYRPFFFTTHTLFDSSDPVSPDVENIADWQKYFGRKVPADEIRAAVYETDTLELIQLQQQVMAKAKPGHAHPDLPGLAKWLRSKKNKEFMQYLLFARRCQPVSSADSPWDEPVRPAHLMEALIQQGQQLHSQARSEFIKLRYAYQLVRLAQYAGKFEQSVAFYEQLVEPNKAQSVIRYWAADHAAGAVLRTAEKPEDKSKYLFSLAFDKAHSRRISAYRGFVWNYDGVHCASCIEMARTTREKTTLHMMEALHWDSNVLPRMEAIYQLDPKSDQLELLLAREINKLEEVRLPEMRVYNPDPAYESDFTSGMRSRLQQSIAGLKALVAKAAREGKVANPPLWQFAEGYLAYLEGDQSRALAVMQQLTGKLPPAHPMHRQARLVSILLKVEQAPVVSSVLEQQVFDEITWLNTHKQSADMMAENAEQYLYWQLAHKYNPATEAAKQFICVSLISLTDLLDEGTYRLSEDVLSFLQRTDKNAFEQHLASKTEYNSNLVEEIQGIQLIRIHRYGMAIDKLSRAGGSSTTDPLGTDPFISSINDCIHCEPDEETYAMHTRLSFAKRMLELQQLALKEKDSEKAAQYYMLLGNGAYNSTYFGPAWRAGAFFRSSGFRDGFEPDEIPPHYDCRMAQQYYEQAMQLTRNPELAAEACFMAAKCAQNVYFMSKQARSNEAEENYYTFFGLLKKNYSRTKYYKEIIEECAYFADFVKQK